MVAAVRDLTSIIPTVRYLKLDGYCYVKGSAEHCRASRWHGAKDGASIPTPAPRMQGVSSPNPDCGPALAAGFLAAPRRAPV